MLRLILGLLKGVALGAGAGYGATRLGFGAGSFGYVVAAVSGLLVGVLCGKAPWRHETIITPILKGIFGGLLCAGLYALGRKFLGGMSVPAAIAPALELKDTATLADATALLTGMAGGVFGAFVEVDDGGKSASKPAKK